MKRSLFIGCALAFLFVLSTPAFAAAKPLVLRPLLPTLSTNFSGGDEVQYLLTTPTSIVLIGTLETTSSPLVTATPLGGSDGFITAVDFHGAHLWDLRLGTSGDDVATTGYLDALGNYWVVGTSAIAANSTTPASGLQRLTVWEINSTGVLENTYTKDLQDVAVPTSMALKGSNYLIQGNSSKIGSPTFTISITTLGTFGTIKYSSISSPLNSQIFTAKSAAYNWLSYVTAKAIKGVLGFTPHQSITVLIKSSLKGGNTTGIYSLRGTPILMQYQVGIGVVVVTNYSGTYLLTLVHTK
ncbi:MAG TPA: hypothetical protein VIH79_03290 [Candidatus Nanopelagicaceae bacterium]